MESEPCLQNGQNKVAISKFYNPKQRRIRMDGPDGGWAWAVALAACLINFIMAGLGRMSGILYVAFIDLFHVDRRGASAPFSVRSSCRNLLGPVVGILGQKYGVRAVTITGGIIGTISAASCFYAHDIVWITVIWGGVNGVGTALTTTLPQVVIGQYFKKYRTTASGMAFSGGCVGSFLFPVLMEYLLANYGIEGTFLIIAGIILHVIPCAMVLKTPPWLKKGGKACENVESYGLEDSCTPADGLHIDNRPMRNGNVPLKQCLEDEPDIKYLQQTGDVVLQLLKVKVPGEKYTSEVPLEINQNGLIPPSDTCILEEMRNLYSLYLYPRRDISNAENSFESANEALPCIGQIKSCKTPAYQKSSGFCSDQSLKLTTPYAESIRRPNSAPDFSVYSTDENGKLYIILKLKLMASSSELEIICFFSEQNRCKAAKVLNDLKKLYTICTKTQMDFTGEMPVKRNSSFHECVPKFQSDVHPKTFWDHIKTAIKLYGNPLFWLICLCRSVHFITFFSVVTCVVDFSMDKGLLQEDGKYVIAAFSLGDLLGRLCLGWITDGGFVALPKYMLFVMIVLGASTATLPLMTVRWTLLATITLFGMLQGSAFIRHPILVSKYMGIHEQSIAMGCLNFFSGFLAFAMPSYIGYFRDTIGSYDYIFYINGSINAFIGFLWIFEPILVRRSPKRRAEDDLA